MNMKKAIDGLVCKGRSKIAAGVGLRGLWNFAGQV